MVSVSRRFIALLGVLAACRIEGPFPGGGPPPPPPPPPPPTMITIAVNNQLTAPITLSSDEVTPPFSGGMAPRSMTFFPIASVVRTLTYSAAPELRGTASWPPPDQGTTPVITITNIVAGTTFITFSVVNGTAMPIELCLVRTGHDPVHLGAVGPAIGKPYGYYAVALPTTELRAYAYPSECTGPYHVWSTERLLAVAVNSGAIALTLADSAGQILTR